MNQTRLRFHVMKSYRRDALVTRWVASSRPEIPEIQAYTDEVWKRTLARPGIKLFDGPMCRLESFQADDVLTLNLTQTSYKVFLGTNLSRPQWADQFGWSVLANPVGLSAALESNDGWLMLGRRNSRVAYYPNRVHPFAGALEPRDPLDVFEEIERELAEELHFKAADVKEIVCLGLVEDMSLRQPELIFHARSVLSRSEIEARLDAAEHTAAVAIATMPDEMAKAVGDPILTPVAAATILLFGRQHFGPAWFDEAAKAVTLDFHDSF